MAAPDDDARSNRCSRSIPSEPHGDATEQPGAIVAAGMFGLDQALGRKPKEEAPIVMAAADEPVDIDHEGIIVPVDDGVSVVAPPQPRSDPLAEPTTTRRDDSETG